jgi:hypothetical protein
MCPGSHINGRIRQLDSWFSTSSDAALTAGGAGEGHDLSLRAALSLTGAGIHRCLRSTCVRFPRGDQQSGILLMALLLFPRRHDLGLKIGMFGQQIEKASAIY